MNRFRHQNFLDYVPHKNGRLSWDVDEKGIVTLHIERQGVSAGLAQKLFGRSRISHVTLEQFGSFLWRQMNGERSIHELAKRLGEQFGDEAEPLYGRLVAYMQTLYRLGYVE